MFSYAKILESYKEELVSAVSKGTKLVKIHRLPCSDAYENTYFSQTIFFPNFLVNFAKTRDKNMYTINFK